MKRAPAARRPTRRSAPSAAPAATRWAARPRAPRCVVARKEARQPGGSPCSRHSLATRLEASDDASSVPAPSPDAAGWRTGERGRELRTPREIPPPPHATGAPQHRRGLVGCGRGRVGAPSRRRRAAARRARGGGAARAAQARRASSSLLAVVRRLPGDNKKRGACVSLRQYKSVDQYTSRLSSATRLFLQQWQPRSCCIVTWAGARASRASALPRSSPPRRCSTRSAPPPASRPAASAS